MVLLSKKSVQAITLFCLLLAAVLLRLQDPPIIERMRYLTFDTYNKLIPRTPHNDVVIIDIDEESLKRHGQWPWSRTLVAELPTILRNLGAKAVVFDMVFAEPDRTSPTIVADSLPSNMESVANALRTVPDNDAVFAQKIKEAGNVVMGFAAANQKTGHSLAARVSFMNEGIKPDAKKFVLSYSDFSSPLDILASAATGNGSFTMEPETDGVIRRVPLIIGEKSPNGDVKNIYPALPLEALRVSLGKSVYKVKSFGEKTSQGYGIVDIKVGDYTIPTDKAGRIWVYYAGSRKDLYIPAWKVIANNIDESRIKDKIVLIGTSAIGLLDLRSSPLDSVLPGVEVHAEIIEQIIHGQFLHRPDFLNGAELVATVFISLFIIFLAPFIGTGILALIGCVLIVGGFIGALYVYQIFGIILDPVYPSLTILIIFIASSVLTNWRSESEKKAVRQAFGQYLSPVLIEELAKNPAKLKLGGETREISVMFSDIRNFTTISEGMDPEELLHVMSDFLTPMTDCVMNNRGTIDKYIGDAMMAFWNAPLDDADHARNACKAALQMGIALKPVNDYLRSRAEKSSRPFRELKAGIGIHTGRASVGNMGSKQRFAYSALGDAVNLSSRLEGQTKVYGVPVIISDATYNSATDFAAIEIDLLIVKGRTEVTRIYALLGMPEDALTDAFIGFRANHSKMLSAYRRQSWDEALTLLDICLAARPDLSALYAVYSTRIAGFKQSPPAADWNGIWVATDK